MTSFSSADQTAVSSPLTPRELTLEAVGDLVADCLALDVAEVRPESLFFNDLAGESIDLLELSFTFEKVFHIKAEYKAFQNKDLWERDESGKLTSAALDLMRNEFGYLNLEQRLAQAKSPDFKSILTIEMMYLMLKHA